MYAKIFQQIYDSSIVENPELRFTFMDLLVLADKDGVVDMTHEAISRRTNRSIEIIRKTISELESPDARSRTPEHDGRRIKRLDDHRDWGWMILNYDRFRLIATEEQRREKTRNRVAKYRENSQISTEKPQCNAPVTLRNAGNAMQRHKHKQRQMQMQMAEAVPSAPPIRTFTVPSVQQVKLLFSKAGMPEREAERFFNYYEMKGWLVGKTKMKSLNGAVANWKLGWEDRHPQPQHVDPSNYAFERDGNL